jgi:hypothetical protein
MRGLQAEGASLTGDEAAAFQSIKNLILVGWIIYPLGFSPIFFYRYNYGHG